MNKLMIAGAAAMLVFTVQAQKMTPDLLWKLGRVSGETVSPDGKSVVYGITQYSIEANKGNRDLYLLDVKSGKSKQLTAMEGSEYNAIFIKNGEALFFMNGGRGFEMDLSSKKITEGIEIEQSVSNVKFSEDGRTVVLTSEVETSESTAQAYPNLPEANAFVYDDLMYRHWDHWSDNKNSHVFIGDYKAGTPTPVSDLMEGEPYDTPLQPFGGAKDVVISKDGKTILYVSKKLTGVEYAESTNSDIYTYDVETGETFNITEQNQGYDMNPSFHPQEPGWILHTSMDEPGYESDKNDLILNNPLTGEMINLTKDWDYTVSSYLWHPDGEKIYIQASINATYQIFELELQKDPKSNTAQHIQQISAGRHNINQIVGLAGKELIVGKQDMNHATELYALDLKKGSLRQLTQVNDEIYNSITTSRVEKRMVPTTDGKEMLTWVIYPPDFDSTKTYPTLLYCQGGPQSAVSQFYSFRWNFQLMAAKGYIVVAPNRRGLPSFGVEWNEAISKDWGGQAMKDYLSAIDAVSKESYVDQNNLGAVGASYGGYSVYMLAGIHENRFKSFISHCGLFNLESWYGSTEELFFANYDIGGPYWRQPQPKSYELFSPHKYAQNWDTPMMVIHGGKDFRVPYTQGLEAYQVARLKGLKSRLLFFPDEGHWILKPQNGVLWHSEFFKWLDETLD